MIIPTSTGHTAANVRTGSARFTRRATMNGVRNAASPSTTQSSVVFIDTVKQRPSSKPPAKARPRVNRPQASVATAASHNGVQRLSVRYSSAQDAHHGKMLISTAAQRPARREKIAPPIFHTHHSDTNQSGTMANRMKSKIFVRSPNAATTGENRI